MFFLGWCTWRKRQQ